jgi:cell division septation protein DedD
VPQLTDEEVERRVAMIGGTSAAASDPELIGDVLIGDGMIGDGLPADAMIGDGLPGDAMIGEGPSGSAVPFADDRAPTQVVVADDPADDRRRLLWRDSATILIGVVIALLVGQSLFPQGIGSPAASPTDLPSGVEIGTFGPPVSLAPGQTFGPIIDPSLGIDATPTPIPVITMGPTPSPSPTPAPSPTRTVKPSASVKPSPKPSKTPGTTPKPTTAPTAEPTAEPTPAPPAAQFTWDPPSPAVLTDIQFTNTSTGDTSWDWDFGDGGTSSAQNPSHAYALPGDYVVKLTVTGAGGTDSVSHTVTVALG